MLLNQMLTWLHGLDYIQVPMKVQGLKNPRILGKEIDI